MRIAVFIKGTTFHKDHGGLETQNRALCEGLAERGHDIVVFSPRKELTVLEKKDNGVFYKFISCTYRMGFFSFFDQNNWVNTSYNTFLSEYGKSPFDLVIGQSSAALGIIRKKHEIGIKVVSISHGTIIGEYKSTVRNVISIKVVMDAFFVLRNFFGRQREFVYGSNRIIAVSTAVKEALIEETFVSEDFITVINNGVDTKVFTTNTYKDTKRPESKVSLIYVGRIIRAKGLFLLLNALKNLKSADFSLNIVGDGEDMNLFKNTAKKFKLFDKINFFGWLDKGLVIEKLYESDIFVLPSLRVEGFPMTIVEAMFCGLPVIASDIGGIKDAVLNGKTGYLIKPGAQKELEEKLKDLLRNQVLRRELGNNGKIKAQKEFSLDTMLNKYEQVLNNL